MPKQILMLTWHGFDYVEFDWLTNNFIFWFFALTFKAFKLLFIWSDKNNNNHCYKERIMKIAMVK